MNKLVPFLLLSSAAATASAQTTGENAAADSLQEVVVTGTSIRGSAPIGTQLTTVDTAAIQAVGATNTADLLASVPLFNSFNISPQGGQSEFNSGGSSTPGLHGLPGTATLVLIDGHRAVGDSPLLNIPDPSSIPPGAIDHIEIVADGGSAIYGSDAVAGVVNIILRKNFNGAETTGSYATASPYYQSSVGQTFGKTWSGGSALIAASYAVNNALQNQDRDFYQAAPQGLAFNPVRNCNPPNVVIGGVNYSGAGLIAGPPSSCDPNLEADIYNRERRYSVVGNIRQNFGESARFFLDAKYTDDASREQISQVTNQTITLPSTNPFFARPAGVTATSETVLWNTGNLNTPLWDEFKSRSGMLDAGVDFELWHEWRLTTDLDYSWSKSSALNEDNGGVNITALNRAIAATTVDTALDPFGNRTNPSVAAGILNYPLVFNGDQTLWDYNIKVDGPVLSLPGGQLKVALGAGYRREEYSGSNPIGVPGDFDFTNNFVDTDRSVSAVFAELALPIVGAANSRSGIRSLNLSVAARYDHYSDFGSTTNPKYGIDWTPIDGLKFRASYGTSFHAPQLADVFGIDTRAGGTFPSSPRPGFILPPGANYQAGYIAGGRAGLLPEEAKNTQVGFDWAPESLPGFKTSVSIWQVKFSNEVQIPISFNLNIPALQARFINLNIVNPATGLLGPLTPAQFASVLRGIRLTGALTNVPPPEVWEILDARRANIGATKVSGVDFDFNYRWTMSHGALTSGLSGEYIGQYKSNAGPGTPYQDNLTNGASTQSSDSSAYNVIPWKVRGTLGWAEGAAAAQTSLNYTGHYNFGYSTPCGATNCNAIQWVSPFVTWDLVVSYALPKDLRVQANIENITDEEPPLVLQGGGFTTLSANPLGRLFRVSLEKRW